MTLRLFACATGKMEFPASELEKTPGKTDLEKSKSLILDIF